MVAVPWRRAAHRRHRYFADWRFLCPQPADEQRGLPRSHPRADLAAVASAPWRAADAPPARARGGGLSRAAAWGSERRLSTSKRFTFGDLIPILRSRMSARVMRCRAFRLHIVRAVSRECEKSGALGAAFGMCEQTTRAFYDTRLPPPPAPHAHLCLYTARVEEHVRYVQPTRPEYKRQLACRR